MKMKKDLIIALALSFTFFSVMLFAFNGEPLSNTVDATLVSEEYPVDPRSDDPLPAPSVKAESAIEEAPTEVNLPEEFLFSGLEEPPPTSVAIEALSQFVKPQAPRPEKLKNNQYLGIPSQARINTGARGAIDTLVFGTDQLDRIPAARFRYSPRYPPHLKIAHVEGRVKLLLTVDTSGKVTGVEVFDSTSPEFNRSAMDAAWKWRFEPGIRNGEPVSFRMLLPFNFNLKD